MPQITSESETARHEARDFFLPGWAEVCLYLLLGVIINLILNAGSIINKLSSNYIGSPDKLKTNFSTLASGFSNSFSSALGGRLGQIILWSVVGALVYMALWLVRNVFNSFENDVISDHYLHPSGYSRAGYWGSSFSVKVFLVAEIAITIGFLFTALTAALPALAALAGSAVYNFHASTSPLYMLFALIGTALVLYIAMVLLRLMKHLWKLL